MEFSFYYITKPIEESFHGFFGHYHLNFDVEAGRNEFIEAINDSLSQKWLRVSIEVERSDTMASDREKWVQDMTDYCPKQMNDFDQIWLFGVDVGVE